MNIYFNEEIERDKFYSKYGKEASWLKQVNNLKKTGLNETNGVIYKGHCPFPHNESVVRNISSHCYYNCTKVRRYKCSK